MLSLSDAWWPLWLATMAGLSTSLGAALAIVRKPSASSMAALLGVALGVMATVSCVELVARNAMSGEGDPFLIVAAAMSGALTYYMLEPLFPKMDEQHDHLKQDDLDDHEAFFRLLQQGPDVERSVHGASQRKAVTASAGSLSAAAAGEGGGEQSLSLCGAAPSLGGGGRESSSASLGSGQAAGGAAWAGEGVAAGHGGGAAGSGAAVDASSSAAASGGLRGPRSGRMLRLGLLMAVTMTLHNLPEGFAVAFSAFTDFGPIMALAIALHNIPEGVIVAAPIYAATGSRWRAIGVATASGLSEPVGALLSLLLMQPFFTQERLHYLLAFVGGVMLAVCGIELWPEGRNCRHDRSFASGILAGSAVMGWTLYVEG
ncbi:hypothetical protein PLESTM_001272600 [Pleodorina starrii]|nr:hypothetical protein PLESTM_001272600 [Pleodorina starrii]